MAAGSGQICPRGCMGCPLGEVNQKRRGFAFTSSLFGVEEGQDVSWALATFLIACRNDFWGGIATSVWNPYRDGSFRNDSVSRLHRQ